VARKMPSLEIAGWREGAVTAFPKHADIAAASERKRRAHYAAIRIRTKTLAHHNSEAVRDPRRLSECLARASQETDRQGAATDRRARFSSQGHVVRDIVELQHLDPGAGEQNPIGAPFHRAGAFMKTSTVQITAMERTKSSSWPEWNATKRDGKHGDAECDAASEDRPIERSAFDCFDLISNTPVT
jgi:hypothetical protein